MEVVDGPHDAAPNHAKKNRDSGFQMFWSGITGQ